MKRKQLVTIKGTKSGLSLHLHDNCSYEDMMRELEDKLRESSSMHGEKQNITVNVELGNRYITENQKEELIEAIQSKKNLSVQDINSNIITKSEAEQIAQENEIVSVASIVRSGQVLEVPGDLLLIGDVNPGGKVVAGGNIYIMGSLKGVAHAGVNGNEKAIVAASVMRPTQLRINTLITRAPDEYPEKDKRDMECAYVDNSEIMIDRLQVLTHLRPNLTKLEGGQNNG
ncbi:septum site-determining protein MinC [Niallia circulans]|uniref:Probable septum site-determining protein MinC n=1 Tax=Niallia circulans TaxID=1397 RepID=A0A553SK84_NIACI|nr:septum site-determining protein MinC [Niallia circulans]TRZ37425.1 septum site-determining protein MinC [Niallia circulans]